MATYHAIIESPLSATETFDYLAMFSNARIWDPGVRDARKLDPGPVRPGTRFRLIIPVFGLQSSLVYTVTWLARPRQLTLEARSWLLVSTDTIEIRAKEDGIAVSYLADVRLRWPFRPFNPMLTAAFPRVAQGAVDGLADALAAADV